MSYPADSVEEFITFVIIVFFGSLLVQGLLYGTMDIIGILINWCR